MKIILFYVFLGAMLITSTNALAVTIIQPREGDTYYTGQILTIELQPSPNDQIDKVFILSENLEWKVLSSPPYKYDVKITKPVNWQEKIGVRIIFKDGTSTLLSTYIYMKLPADIEVNDILIERMLTVITMNAQKAGKRAIYADGIFSDGSKYPLNSYNQTKYQSLNETIAKVDSSGLITAVFPGETKILVSAGNVSKEVEVFVEYKIDPLKGITATALDKSNEIKWEKSPYEGEIVSDYRIYRSKDYEGMGKVLIGTVPAGITSFTDTNPVAGVKYYYSVQAYSLKYNSGSSMKNLWILPSAVPTASN